MALAPQVTNIGTQGQNARYDTTGTWFDPSRGLFTDGQYFYREQGSSVLSEDRPDSFVPGLPGANDNGPGGAGGGGGGSSVFGNPYFSQYEAALKAQQAADLADTRSQIQQLLIQFGIVPGNYQDKIGALDDTIRKLIEENTTSGISQYARLLEGKGDMLRQSIGNLGTRGLLRSGAKGYRLRRNQLTYDRGLSDSISALLGNLNSLQGGYAGRESQRQMGLSQFLSQLMSQWSPPSYSGPSGPQSQQSGSPQMSRDQAVQYWQSNPAPTYTAPSGTSWYGGFGGLESSPFKGKALDSLF